jgi:Zn ribbon nucleic-acid-binding protein/transposase-like protein
MNLPLPADAIEFDRLYGDDDICRQTLISARWPNGFVCPRCGHSKCWDHRRRPLVECASCGHQASALAGTLFHGAKLKLPKLFKLVYLMVAEKCGTNACALSRQVSVSHQTARLWVRKVRTAMTRPDREKLKGTVEVDQATLGGPAARSEGGRHAPNKAQILVLVEDDNGACGRIRLEVAAKEDSECLFPIIEKHVESGSVVRTDGGAPYKPLRKKGKPHEVQQNPGYGESKQGYLQLVHLVTSLLKRFINGVLHGSWTHAWLQLLLDEFVFRFNRRHCQHRPALFNRVIEFGVVQRAPTRTRFEQYANVFKPLRLPECC